MKAFVVANETTITMPVPKQQGSNDSVVFRFKYREPRLGVADPTLDAGQFARTTAQLQ
jgi:hypothetical protein